MPQGRGRGSRPGPPTTPASPDAPERAGRPAAARRGQAALTDRLTELIEPVVQQAGFDLERVAVARVGRRHNVQVVIDSDDGVGLDAIAEVSHVVSGALDAAEEAGGEVVPGEYVLEVSSPGVDRPLTQPRHWRRNLGRLVTVSGPDGGTLTGRITEVTADGVVLEVEGARRELPFDQLGPGRIQVELRRPDEVGDDEGEGERR